MADKTTTIVMVARDMASGNIAKVRSELHGLGSASSSGVSGFGRLGAAASKVEGALGHARSQIAGVASGLTMFGGLAAVGGLTAFLGATINKTESLGNATLKLTQITGESAQSMSSLIAVGEKWGIGQDALTTSAAMYEKMVGKLSMTTAVATTVQDKAAQQSLLVEKARLEQAGASTKAVDAELKLIKAEQTAALPANKLIQLQQQYGIALTDAKGHALSYTDALGNIADAYKAATTAADKAKVAAVASQVMGRGYAQLIPILALGKQGMMDAEAEAQQLGATLTNTNMAQLAQLRTVSQRWTDTLSGIEIQAGLTFIPMLTNIGTAANKWLGDPNNRASLIGALKGVEGFAETAAGAIVGVGKAIAGIWGMIPGPMKTLLLSGLVAQKASSWLFGSGPLQWGKSLLGSALGRVPVVGGIASAVAGVQHVWVDNMGVGGLGGLGSAVSAGAGETGATGFLAAVGGATGLAAIATVAVPAFMLAAGFYLTANNPAGNGTKPSAFTPQASGPTGYTPQASGRSIYSPDASGNSIYSPNAAGRSIYSPGGAGSSMFSPQAGATIAAALAATIPAVHQGEYAKQVTADTRAAATHVSSALTSLLTKGVKLADGVSMLGQMANAFANSVTPSLYSERSALDQGNQLMRQLIAKRDTATADRLQPILDQINASILSLLNPLDNALGTAAFQSYRAGERSMSGTVTVNGMSPRERTIGNVMFARNGNGGRVKVS